MLPRLVAIAMFASACGSVADNRPVDGGSSGPTPDGSAATTYMVQVAKVPPAPFGGGNSCGYTITLQQLDVELAILPSGEVTTGHVQDLNVELVVPSAPPTTPFTCTTGNPGVIAPNIATYTLDSAKPSATGMTLSFQGATGNMPSASLVAELSVASGVYSAVLTFHRIDIVAPFDWTVTTPTVTLAPP